MAASIEIVTSPHPLATKAGAKVLRAGGDAIEAAIAIGATIGVVYPHFCGLGGDAIWLVADREGRRAAFLGIGQAAEGASRRLTARSPLAGRSPCSTTACAVNSWRHADGVVGAGMGRPSSPFSAFLGDAIVHARDGFPVSRSQAFWLAFRGSDAARWPGLGEVFMPNGPPEVGSLFRQHGFSTDVTRP